MNAAKLAQLKAETEQLSTSKPGGEKMALPRGVAARIDATDLRQLLEEYDAMKKALELALVHFDEAIHGRRPTTPPLKYIATLRAALAKAGEP